MTFFLLATGVILVGLSGRLVARAVAVPRLQLKAHLRNVAEYGFESPSGEADDLSFSERFKRSLRDRAERLGRFVMRTVPAITPLKPGELAAAGIYDDSPEVVHGYRVMAAMALPLLILLLLLAAGGLSGLAFLLVFSTAGAGWVLPSFLIRKRGKARLDDIDRKLPELIDLLIATIEAGMGFTASLMLISERFDGALGDELRLTMRQQTLGMSVSQALDDMAERCDTASIRAFVRTAGRGETLGVSIGPVLRELSSDQRRRRRQAAREKMQKAPVKMIFPLMFLIMPALMIILMFPAAYSLVTNLSGV
jgi:tight adherence protein C